MHGVWCLITDFKSSTDLHISCIILIEKVYCSKFTLFKTRFISLSHFSFLHKIEYATPGFVFICQKKKKHTQKKLVMSSLSTHGQSRICMYNICTLIECAPTHWTFLSLFLWIFIILNSERVELWIWMFYKAKKMLLIETKIVSYPAARTRFNVRLTF